MPPPPRRPRVLDKKAPKGAPSPKGAPHAKKPPARGAKHMRAEKTALAGTPSWIYTCRAGFESDLVDELVLAKATIGAAVVAPALVASASPPARPMGRLDLSFARQAFPVSQVVDLDDTALPETLALRTAEALAEVLSSRPGGRGAPRPWLLQAWVPDSDTANRLSPEANALAEAVIAHLADRHPSLSSLRADLSAVEEGDGWLAQICLAKARRAYVGVLPITEAISTAPGGRMRMRVGSGAPSRAARKLEEALDWLGLGPEPGETCVDLGAAPGGWTWVATERRAKVICVDPGKLDPDIAKRRGVTHVRGSAFDYEPPEPVDWLLCDMVWRPLEVASLLARWGRRKNARMLVANIKLPMHKKAGFVARIRTIVASGNWHDIRTRQLYHDREEVTLVAWLRP